MAHEKENNAKLLCWRVGRSAERDNIFYEVQRVPSEYRVKWVTVSTNWKSFQWIRSDWKNKQQRTVEAAQCADKLSQKKQLNQIIG